MTNDLTSTNLAVPFKGGHGPKNVDKRHTAALSRHKPHPPAYGKKKSEITLAKACLPITNNGHDVRWINTSKPQRGLATPY